VCRGSRQQWTGVCEYSFTPRPGLAFNNGGKTGTHIAAGTAVQANFSAILATNAITVTSKTTTVAIVGGVSDQ